MDISMADARQRLREVLDRVGGGEVVRVTRRGRVVAVIAPPRAPEAGDSFADVLRDWRATWDVASWPDEDLVASARDPSPGRAVDL